MTVAAEVKNTLIDIKMSAIIKPHVDHKPNEPALAILESWSEGTMGGALVVMSMITIANMRRSVSLHKMILVELLCALPNCFAMFVDATSFGWYLSSVSTLLILSWTLHNIIGWIKSKPFLSVVGSKAYIATVILVQPYWMFQIVTNFLYFNKSNPLYVHSRPLEPLFRDPWWIFTTVNLFWNIKHRYEFSFVELMTISPRFAILLSSMSLSVIFLILEVLAVTSVLNMGGLNPFWRLSFIFKCFTDTIILDDFKTVLDKLSQRKRTQMQLVDTHYGSETTCNRQSSVTGKALVTSSQTASQDVGAFHIEHAFSLDLREPSSARIFPSTAGMDSPV